MGVSRDSSASQVASIGETWRIVCLQRIMRAAALARPLVGHCRRIRARDSHSPGPAAAPRRGATITPADLRTRAALMGATGWRLLLGLNLGHPVSQALVEEARVATSVFGSSLAGLEIGNEPDLYTRSVSAPFRYLLGGGA